MQNQPLPKSNITESYYLRQVWYYLLGVVIHTEDKILTKETVHFYRWCESDGGRGATEISSCVWNFLESKIIEFIDNGVSCTSGHGNASLLLDLPNLKLYSVFDPNQLLIKISCSSKSAVLSFSYEQLFFVPLIKSKEIFLLLP